MALAIAAIHAAPPAPSAVRPSAHFSKGRRTDGRKGVHPSGKNLRREAAHKQKGGRILFSLFQSAGRPLTVGMSPHPITRLGFNPPTFATKRVHNQRAPILQLHHLRPQEDRPKRAAAIRLAHAWLRRCGFRSSLLPRRSPATCPPLPAPPEHSWCGALAAAFWNRHWTSIKHHGSTQQIPNIQTDLPPQTFHGQPD